MKANKANNKRIIFYLPEYTINDASQHFLNLMKKAFLDSGFEIIISNNWNFKILSTDYIFVTNIKNFIKIYLRSRSNNIIYWSQGLLSEEHVMMSKKTMLNRFKGQIFSFLEKITLKKSIYVIYVSDYMRKYLDAKHSFQNNSYSIIPCYNKKLDKKYFNSSLKKKTSFVYAGGIFSWQCFEQTVALYKEIERENSNAFFTVLTKQKEEAEGLLSAANIKNYEILYVPLKDLDEELAKHKYGFVLREDNIVNSCATPTKMNTYLAVGLIPIYTNAIPAFNAHLNLGSYGIKLNLEDDNSKLAKEIIDNDNHDISYDEYYKICQESFKNFYDDEYSIDLIKTDFIKKNN